MKCFIYHHEMFKHFIFIFFKYKNKISAQLNICVTLLQKICDSMLPPTLWSSVTEITRVISNNNNVKISEFPLL